MADPTTQRVRVGFTVTRPDTGRWHVRCEFSDNPHDVEGLAPMLRSGRSGFDCREGVGPEQAAELARLMSEALSHLTHTALTAWFSEARPWPARGGNDTRAGSSAVLMNCPTSPAVRVAASIRPAHETSIPGGEAPSPRKLSRRGARRLRGTRVRPQSCCAVVDHHRPRPSLAARGREDSTEGGVRPCGEGPSASRWRRPASRSWTGWPVTCSPAIAVPATLGPHRRAAGSRGLGP
jgi:hypothetical protein